MWMGVAVLAGDGRVLAAGIDSFELGIVCCREDNHRRWWSRKERVARFRVSIVPLESCWKYIVLRRLDCINCCRSQENLCDTVRKRSKEKGRLTCRDLLLPPTPTATFSDLIWPGCFSLETLTFSNVQWLLTAEEKDICPYATVLGVKTFMPFPYVQRPMRFPTPVCYSMSLMATSWFQCGGNLCCSSTTTTILKTRLTLYVSPKRCSRSAKDTLPSLEISAIF